MQEAYADPDIQAQAIEVGKSLILHPWRFAKTMPYVPHYYSLRTEWAAEDADFMRAVRFIHDYGLDEMYGKRPFKILLVNEFKYWTMDFPLDTTDLINRKPHGFPCDSTRGIVWVRF